MKITWLSTLRAILTLVYFFSWISAVLAPFTLFLFTDGLATKFTNFGEDIYNIHWTFYLVLALSVIGYWFFLGMIYHLRKASYRISPHRFIDELIKVHLYKAGLFCVIGLLITKLPTYIYKYVTMPIVKDMDLSDSSNSVHLGISFDSAFVLLAFGIFLIIISKIMNESIIIQEENELTI
ncbi:DUF2975 domain-containing protein [Nonlabens sp. Asnod2-A12]|uniref:DUF2975 domain-containing protein n=1 Tax=Nonlabens sp. Asnod2-A12 TaxID=3160578 RepID=UPI0038648F3D